MTIIELNEHKEGRKMSKNPILTYISIYSIIAYLILTIVPFPYLYDSLFYLTLSLIIYIILFYFIPFIIPCLIMPHPLSDSLPYLIPSFILVLTFPLSYHIVPYLSPYMPSYLGLAPTTSLARCVLFFNIVYMSICHIEMLGE